MARCASSSPPAVGAGPRHPPSPDSGTSIVSGPVVDCPSQLRSGALLPVAAPRGRAPVIGLKVVDRARSDDGIGEVASYPDDSKTVQVDYYLGPVEKMARRLPLSSLSKVAIPAQTRCYYREGSVQHLGRVIEGAETPKERTYLVRFPNGHDKVLKETEFHVRSHLLGADPVATLAGLAHESPFLFERRNRWLNQYYRQETAVRGLVGLVSSKIELFPHQVEVVRRVVSDPTMRYLLADEVGLGKTIEAGAILRQIYLDAPELSVHVFTPKPLVHQWTKELEERFGLLDVQIHEHDDLGQRDLEGVGVLVIDEAHQIVDGKLYRDARRLADPLRTKHVLLLSATPVLHHEEQLLALLELLDPDVFRRGDLNGFRQQLEGRKELGRALLALSRTTRAAYVSRHIRRCAELLPNDPLVASAAAESRESGDAADVLAIASRLRIHLTETYRLHRRLLRTRRAVLVEQGDLCPRRSSEDPLTDEDGPSHADLWLAIDEWRTRAAAFAIDKAADVRRSLTEKYLAIANAAGGDPSAVPSYLKSRKPAFPGETEIACQIEELAKRVAHRRAQTIAQLLRKLDTGRWVGFVSQSARLESLRAGIARLWGGPILTLTEEDDSTEYADKLEEFRKSTRVLLLADGRAEEGLNLQVADGLLLLDLPFAPMRIEQRIGRLDRLDRTKTIKCFPFLSSADPSVAFDAAWHRVVRDGLAIFKDSISDLQFMLELEMKRLGDAAFEGGPGALLREADRLAGRLAAEREAAAEQDILDGLYVGELRESPLWSAIEEADEEEDEFGESLTQFVEGNLGLKAWKEDGVGRTGTTLKFQRKGEDSQPLIPAEKLHTLALYAAEPGTVNRSLAAKRTDLCFYRPGELLVDELRDLALWDERGQAFAMWRAAPYPVPQMVFRCTIRSGVILAPVEETLHDLGWDELSRSSLVRMLLGWLPTSECEVFLGVDGSTAPPELTEVCARPYSNSKDINLSGKRAQILLDLTGEKAWPDLCARIAAAAKDTAHRRADYQEQLEAARREARDYFETGLARTRARARVDKWTDVAKAETESRLLADLVARVLSNPRHKVDTIGVYVLSSEPACSR
jgi:ATP-dependent helicase HepA